MPLPTPQRELVTAIEFDLWDGTLTHTLRVSDVGPVLAASIFDQFGIPILDDARSTGFRPCLYVPVEISMRLVSTGLADVMPSSGDSDGTIKFSLRDSRPGHPATDPPLWQYLDMSWLGRVFRIYTGELDTQWSDYDLSYQGRIEDVTHDTLDVTVRVADFSKDLDDVLVPQLFDSTFVMPGITTLPDTLKEKPIPELRGAAYNIPAVLISDTDFGAPLYFQVSRHPLFQIMEVRVGGVPWDQVAANPVAGQWAPLLSDGRFVLGGITGGLEVRCDARSSDWDQMTTAKLMTDFVIEGQKQVNTASMTQLAADAPHLIGWWTGTDPVNRLDAFDTIMAGVGGWWAMDSDAKIIAGVYNRAGPIPFTDPFETPEILTHDEESDFPETDADIVLRNNVSSIQLIKTIPQVRRVRVEHNHNYGPLTTFYDSVRETDQQIWQEPGIVSEAWENVDLKITEPRSVDLPIIKSLVNTEGDARFIRDRVASVFGAPRKIYEVKAYADTPPLYGFAFVDFMMVHGFFRVLSVTRGFGAGPITIHIWG